MVIKHSPHFRIRPEMRGIFVMLLLFIGKTLYPTELLLLIYKRENTHYHFCTFPISI